MPNRLHGKIANAPLAVRDGVNAALRDGKTYEEVAAQFPDLDLNAENLRKWMRPGGGHERWLKEKAALDDMRAKREFALRIVQENEGSQIHEAGMQIAASQIYELLSDWDVEALRAQIQEDPSNFPRIVNAMAKLSDSGLKYERYRAEVAAATKRVQAELDRAKKKGGIQPETIELIERELKLL